MKQCVQERAVNMNDLLTVEAAVPRDLICHLPHIVVEENDWFILL